jgi:hypothetical protein
VSALDQAAARRIAGSLGEPRVKCDGDHGGPRCADPECWNDSPATPAAEPPIYVVVCQNDKPHPSWGVDPDGPLVHETYVNAATLDNARARSGIMEQHGACRVARLVFEDVDGSAL